MALYEKAEGLEGRSKASGERSVSLNLSVMDSVSHNASAMIALTINIFSTQKVKPKSGHYECIDSANCP